MSTRPSLHAGPGGGSGPLQRLRDAIESVVRGKSEVVEHVLTALLARGHVLIEDVPGTGKTTLASATASALGCSFSRIQFTADLLPSDILGVSIFEPERSAFRFHPGPVFANIVLADEINRTPPKTQSSLLEAMNEGQVSIEGAVRPLPQPFFVIATQNPLEHYGTFPLPESQVDRFLMRLAMGYPDLESERELLRSAGGPRRTAPEVLDPEQVLSLQAQAMAVSTHRDIEDYVLAIVRATREHPEILLGASPRASQGLIRASRARAFIAGRDHVVPDDVQAVAEPVLAHRLVPSISVDPAAGSVDLGRVLRGILASVPVPR